MIVSKSVNFNGKNELTAGKVIGDSEESFLVLFVRFNVEFCGWWKKNECKVREI